MTEYGLIPAAILATRGVCHFLLFLRVVTFQADGHSRHRHFIGACAAMFAGANLAESIRIASNFAEFAPSVQPYLTIIIAFVLLFTIWSGGNVARLLPRRIVDKLP